MDNSIPTGISIRTGRLGLVLVLLYLTALILVLGETTFSMVYTWGRLQTYNHGYLIAPISLWLIWERRSALERTSPTGSLGALILLAGCGIVWFMGSVVDALVVQQFGLVAMAIAGVWAILGTRLTSIIFFPLMYLFFMVPVGDDLVPPLMEFTATFTVEAVRLSGIPVYREDMYFSLPSGNWNVIGACSGARYLIASVALGALFAYLNYRSWQKRAWFMLASIIVPIIANGIRAYSIVMIGHFSGMKLAVGVDHLLWGWVFFGIVMFILFSLGAIWRDKDALEEALSAPSTTIRSRMDRKITPVLGACGAALILLFWSFMANQVKSMAVPDYEPEITFSQQAGGWEISRDNPLKWRPSGGDEDRTAQLTFSKEGDRLTLFLQQYVDQEQGEEIIRSGPFLTNEYSVLPARARIVEDSNALLTLNGRSVKVNRSILESQDARRIVVWWWYRVDGIYTSHPYYVKALEALSYAGLQSPLSARIFLAYEVGTGKDTEELAQHFLDDALGDIESALDKLQ